MNVLDLFSGIGGFSLGLERAEMRTVAFCEIDPYCRRVLAKHWPTVPIYDDIRALTAVRLAADGIIQVAPNASDLRCYARRSEQSLSGTGEHGKASSIDVICGGFPCQDISVAGKGAGIDGTRSGLWSEYARIIGELRPRYVIVENVSALLGRGLDRVLGDLAALGYDAEWHCIPASAVGAPHRRDRLWIVAYPVCNGFDVGAAVSSSDQIGETNNHIKIGENWHLAASNLGNDMADAVREGLPIGLAGTLGTAGHTQPERQGGSGGQWWSTEPDVGRVAHGVPSRVDRLRGLGNAVIPQIPEIIGRAIMSAAA